MTEICIRFYLSYREAQCPDCGCRDYFLEAPTPLDSGMNKTMFSFGDKLHWAEILALLLPLWPCVSHVRCEDSSPLAVKWG